MTGPNGSREVDYRAVAEWLHERTEKMRGELGPEHQYVIDAFQALVDDHLLHAYPSPDTLATTALARRTLLRMAAMHQEQVGYLPEWAPTYTTR